MSSAPASEYLPELARCSVDPWHFFTRYCFVSDPHQGTIRFEPWPHLHKLTVIILANDRVIILKSRQVGVSWLLACLGLWYSLFTPNANVLIFSRRQVEAIAMKERAKFTWRYLPDWLKQPIGKDNDEMLTFPQMESKIQSFPATEGAGRGETATIAIIDEFADIEYDRELYTAVLPTVEHGKLVGASTAKGSANLFAQIYWDAKQSKNSFVPVFVPYDVLASRTEAWWELQRQNMPAYLALQEYPKHEADAFLIAGTCMFDVDALRSMPAIPNYGGETELFMPPTEGHTYSAGVDTALGVVSGDFSVLQIIDNQTGDQAAKIRTRRPIEQFCEVAYDLLARFGKPNTIIEEQPQGRLVFKYLNDKRYPLYRIYHRSKNIPCFHTTEQNRREVLSLLEQAIRLRQLTLRSQESVNECLSFGYNETKDRFQALSGNDDEVISLALACYLRSAIPPAPDENAYRPISYIGGGQRIDRINWRKADPFEKVKGVQCPACRGERWPEVAPGRHEVCQNCRGLGMVLVPR